MIKDANYFVVFGWMATKCGLKGTERDAYAIILGFSQTPDQWFTGSIQYIADFAGVTYRAAMDALHSLVEKGLIIREKAQYGNSYRYRATIAPKPTPEKKKPIYDNGYKEVMPVYDAHPAEVTEEEERAFRERWKK